MEDYFTYPFFAQSHRKDMFGPAKRSSLVWSMPRAQIESVQRCKPSLASCNFPVFPLKCLLVRFPRNSFSISWPVTEGHFPLLSGHISDRPEFILTAWQRFGHIVGKFYLRRRENGFYSEMDPVCLKYSTLEITIKDEIKRKSII